MVQLELGSITVEVELKDIKNVHLSVYPPNGRVRIAAPLRMQLDTVRVYALSKLGWIKKQQQKFQAQEREAPREYLNRESHYFLGKRYMLKVTERPGKAEIRIRLNRLELLVPTGSTPTQRKTVVDKWYRDQLRSLSTPLFEKWQDRIGVTPSEVTIRKMKTKWGSCQTDSKRILLNLELAKKPVHCIEYIIVHELVHLMEPSHNARFMSLMDQYLPEWKHLRDELNKLPVSHVEWGY